jgi:hypothetical protein
MLTLNLVAEPQEPTHAKKTQSSPPPWMGLGYSPKRSPL